MMTLNDISTKLNMLAAEVGGNHHTNKETEQLLRDLSDEVYKLSFEIRKSLAAVVPFTGITDKHFELGLRHEDMEENKRK